VVVFVFGATGTAAASRERYVVPEAVTTTPTTASNEGYVEATDNPGDDPSSSTMPEGVISAPAVEEGAVPQENVRPRPESRPVDLASAAADEAAGDPTSEATEQPSGPPRLDDPVLRWLPEIVNAAAESGTPANIIAGVMRLESGGNPSIISPVGARGLMQIMPSNLSAMGVPDYLWHDPASNISAGGRFLASQAASYGSWETAVGAYFGFGCDVFGTCTETYISVAFSWAAYYAPAIADPYNSGFALLPADWVAPPIVPFVEAAPEPVRTPPPSPPTPTKTPTPGTSPEPGTTPEPTESPTDVPTDEPTPVPTEEPTEVPTEIPTEVPTEVPTDVPVEEPPVDEGTPPA
jgi:hypothetical protein